MLGVATIQTGTPQMQPDTPPEDPPSWITVVETLRAHAGSRSRDALIDELQKLLPERPGAGRIWQLLSAMEEKRWLQRSQDGWQVILTLGPAAPAAPQPEAPLIDRLTEGAIVQGVVAKLSEHGALLDLGGLMGLMHISDMAWRRLQHPSEVVKLGDELQVCVLRVDRERQRVSLGLKQLAGDPWQDFVRRHAEGARTSGRVVNVMQFGCFVELAPGVEGLVHISDQNPGKPPQVDDTIEVMVLEIDHERRRISLGQKQCLPDPWEAFARSFKAGARLAGRIASIHEFGLFIRLDNGLDGLVHRSDIQDPDSQRSIGMLVEVVLLSVDVPRQRIALSLPAQATP